MTFLLSGATHAMSCLLSSILLTSCTLVQEQMGFAWYPCAVSLFKMALAVCGSWVFSFASVSFFLTPKNGYVVFAVGAHS
jgi:hypothetical protein